jgi:hypothetical protein
MGMPIETEINIPQAAFEVTLEPFLKCLIQRYEQSFLMKNKQLLEFQKQSVIAGYYPTLSLSAGYYIGQGPQMPWGAKPSDGVLD